MLIKNITMVVSMAVQAVAREVAPQNAPRRSCCSFRRCIQIATLAFAGLALWGADFKNKREEKIDKDLKVIDRCYDSIGKIVGERSLKHPCLVPFIHVKAIPVYHVRAGLMPKSLCFILKPEGPHVEIIQDLKVEATLDWCEALDNPTRKPFALHDLHNALDSALVNHGSREQVKNTATDFQHEIYLSQESVNGTQEDPVEGLFASRVFRSVLDSILAEYRSIRDQIGNIRTNFQREMHLVQHRINATQFDAG